MLGNRIFAKANQLCLHAVLSSVSNIPEKFSTDIWLCCVFGQWVVLARFGVLFFTTLAVILTPHLKPSLINLNCYCFGNNEKLEFHLKC